MKRRLFQSVFNNGYREPNPFKWIARFFRNVKWGFQRVFRGYSDQDVANMDGWLDDIIPPMLRQLAEQTTSYPIDKKTAIQRTMSSEFRVISDEAYEENLAKWQGVLRRMAAMLDDSTEEYCSWKNPYDITDDELDRDKWLEEEKRIAAYRQDCLEEFCDMLKEHYGDLWW